ncbi:MAG: carbamoyl phosphate synthase small subunit [Kiritimatiellaceae bacterium TMED266]|nr:MAG: carbamoyl phosphate synthase small subunit [Kiritimatiellaceae bacterium TMED266]
MPKAIIALEDGTWFEGTAFAGSGEAFGELVFNTSMTGYQEIITDPSYHGQIVTLTYPLIGNYGINQEDEESRAIFAQGLIIGEYSRMYSNWRAEQSLASYLEANGKIGIHEVDTRAITLHIRDKGAMKCVISTEESDPAVLVEKAKASPGLVGRDLATEVTIDQPYSWPAETKEKPLYRIAVVDCGIKLNQLRILESLGCHCTVFPNTVSATEIVETNPDGIFISNGPGDPAGAPKVTQLVEELIASKRPLFGICFGHQMLSMALGAKSYKLKFGHRGGNQPIQDLRTQKVEIASHNHGFCIDADSVNPELAEITHLNLNDRTVAGIKHKHQPLFCVQYHPEAAPGPHDPFYLFEEFIDMIKETNT